MIECPYCLSLIADGEKIEKCRICGAVYHAECFSENGGCAIKNCERLAGPKGIEIEVDAEPRTMLVLSRESVEKTPAALPVKQHNPCAKCGRPLAVGELYCPECDPGDPDKISLSNAAPVVVLIGIIALVVGWMAVSVLAPLFGAR